MTLTLPSPAKLNLFLYITGQRADSYHNLQTLFHFLDYGDTLTFSANTQSSAITLATPLPNVPDEKNLILLAARLLQKYTQCDVGAMILVNKILPMGGGLGGASSNAATTLLALNQLWNCQLTLQQLQYLGQQLGADVPIFIYGHSAFAEGTGNILQPVTVPERWYVVANPNEQSSTAVLFNHPDLQRNTPSRLLAQCLAAPYSNDCEVIVRKLFAGVEYLIAWLLQYGSARLTGTGTCVFAEFDDENQARSVLSKLPVGMQGFVAKGVNQSPLQRALTTL